MKVCSVEGCDDKHWAKTYCRFHYERSLKGMDVNLPKRQPSAHGTVSRYTSGCRCNVCRAAMRARYQALRVPCSECGELMSGHARGRLCRRCWTKAQTKPLIHGTERGYNKGCRCEFCIRASRRGRQERRERNKVPCIVCGTFVLHPKDKSPSSTSGLALCRHCSASPVGVKLRGLAR